MPDVIKTKHVSKRQQRRLAAKAQTEQTQYRHSSAGLLERVTFLEDEIMGLDFVLKHPDDTIAQENVRAVFARLRDVLQQVDMRQVSKTTGQRIVWYAYNHFDDIVREIKERTLASSFYLTLGIDRQEFQQAASYLYGQLLEARKETGAIAPRQVDEKSEPAQLVFPRIPHVNPTITQAAKQLEAAWQRAANRNLSISDQFTVNAIATNYLPSSLKLLDDLAKYSTESKAESEKIFLEQLHLLQRQLDEIFKHEERETLTQMRAHSRFLASKVEPGVNLGLEN